MKKNIYISIIICIFASMKLSIIIPVYKTQDTLDRCLQSVLLQSFTDYEIILVDDESPDDCPKLCDEYTRKMKKYKFFIRKMVV